MKKIFYWILLLSFSSTSAQFMEFGGGLGSMNYSGDLVRGYSFSTSSLAGTAFYRMNFSEIFTVRLGATLGTLRGAETPIDAFAVQRDQSFSARLLELSSVFEYHFLDFKTKNAPVNFSPYIFGGLGVLRYNAPTDEEVGRFQFSLPMGVGFKYLIQKRFTVSIEAGARKTFFDYLDGISDGDITNKNYQYGNPKDDDWYFYSGLSFSIILFNVPCPFPYNPNQSLLAR
ncbi:MAG: DUF6089 family protein [Bacteroidota bacterium]